MAAEAEITGVSVASVKDGTLFYMTAEYVKKILALAESNEHKKIVVFVKHNLNQLLPQ